MPARPKPVISPPNSTRAWTSYLQISKLSFVPTSKLSFDETHQIAVDCSKALAKLTRLIQSRGNKGPSSSTAPKKADWESVKNLIWGTIVSGRIQDNVLTSFVRVCDGLVTVCGVVGSSAYQVTYRLAG